jgi:hypothetical protein
MSTDNPRLPLELQESILSHLAGSLDFESYRPMLASCTLVCHAWRSIVQPWLFTDLVFRTAVTEVDNIAKFFDTSSPTHHLSKHIKSITVKQSYSQNVARCTLNAMLRAMDERKIFRLFNAVQHIGINLGSDSLSEEDITLLSHFRQLRKVQLITPWPRAVSFHDLVSTFPALTHLELCGANFSDSGPAHVRALKLQRLVITLFQGSPTVSPVMRLDAPGLKFLMLKWLDYLNSPYGEPLIQNLIASIPLENIKTLNLIGHNRDPADVIPSKSWRPLITHSVRVLKI